MNLYGAHKTQVIIGIVAILTSLTMVFSDVPLVLYVFMGVMALTVFSILWDMNDEEWERDTFEFLKELKEQDRERSRSEKFHEVLMLHTAHRRSLETWFRPLTKISRIFRNR